MVEVISTVFTGICNGAGTAIGSYLATRYAIKKYEEMMESRKQEEGKP